MQLSVPPLSSAVFYPSCLLLLYNNEAHATQVCMPSNRKSSCTIGVSLFFKGHAEHYYMYQCVATAARIYCIVYRGPCELGHSSLVLLLYSTVVTTGRDK